MLAALAPFRSAAADAQRWPAAPAVDADATQGVGLVTNRYAHCLHMVHHPVGGRSHRRVCVPGRHDPIASFSAAPQRSAGARRPLDWRASDGIPHPRVASYTRTVFAASGRHQQPSPDSTACRECRRGCRRHWRASSRTAARPGAECCARDGATGCDARTRAEVRRARDLGHWQHSLAVTRPGAATILRREWT